MVHGLTGGIRPYLALSLLCLALYLPGLAALPPMDRDESRFIQATRQMLESGDFPAYGPAARRSLTAREAAAAQQMLVEAQDNDAAE